MSFYSFAHWLERREWALDFSASSYAYPIVLATHLSCIAVFGGMVLVTNFRLLGWALTCYPISDVMRKLRFWKRLGFLLMVTSGLLMAGSEAGKYYGNPFFWTKVALLALIGVHALVFRRSVYRKTTELDLAPVVPGHAKLAAAASLILWTGVVCAGRLIGYYI